MVQISIASLSNSPQSLFLKQTPLLFDFVRISPAAVMHRPVFFILAIASSITSIAATTPYGRHRVILDEGERPETLWQADAFEPENVTPMLPKERRDIDPVPVRPLSRLWLKQSTDKTGRINRAWYNILRKDSISIDLMQNPGGSNPTGAVSLDHSQVAVVLPWQPAESSVASPRIEPIRRRRLTLPPRSIV